MLVNMIDLGANVQCDVRNLVEFAVMGDVFARTVLGLMPSCVAISITSCSRRCIAIRTVAIRPRQRLRRIFRTISMAGRCRPARTPGRIALANSCVETCGLWGARRRRC